MSEQFWKPEPKSPGEDWGMWVLSVPIIVSVIGFAVVGVFAFSFDAIKIVSQFWQDAFTIAGSALVVIGAEANTPGTFIAVFRKWQKDGNANGFDWSAVFLSGVGTLANLLVVFAILIQSSDKFTGGASWLSWVLDWGPLVAGIAVACDYYGSLIELGFLFGAYELRYERWLVEKRAFELEQQKPNSINGTQFSHFDTRLSDLEHDLWNFQMIPATYDDFVRVMEINENGGTPDFLRDKGVTGAMLAEMVENAGRRSTTKTSCNKWRKQYLADVEVKK